MSAEVLAPRVTPAQAYEVLHPEPPPEQVNVIARLMGLTPEALWALERQHVPPPSEVLRRACDLLLLDDEHALTAFLYEPGDPPAYVLVGAAGQASVSSRQLLEFRHARPALLAATGQLVPMRSRQQWDAVVRLLLKAQTVVALAPEETRAGRAAEWVRLHLASRPPVEDVDDAAVSEYPWTDAAGAVCVFGTAVRKSLLCERQQHVTDREFGQAMRAAGCEPFQVKVRTAEGRTTRSAWRLPADLSTV